MPLSLGLSEAAAFLRVHEDTLRKRAKAKRIPGAKVGRVLQKLGAWSDLRMVMNYAHHSPGYLAGFANNTKRKT